MIKKLPQLRSKRVLYASTFSLLLILNPLDLKPALADFDPSDLVPPTVVGMSVLNPAPLDGKSPVVIEVKVQDDKNWAHLSGTLNIGYTYILQAGLTLPPNCLTVNSTFNKLSPVENINARVKDANGTTHQVFWLVGFLPAPKALPGTCPEYRKLTTPPILLINGTSFSSTIPKGSKIAVISGGIFTPVAVDDSGRSSVQKSTNFMAPERFMPANLNFPPVDFCVPYAVSKGFETGGSLNIARFAKEQLLSGQLGIEEIRVPNDADIINAQMKNWNNFDSDFTYSSLTMASLCPTAFNSSTVSTAYAAGLKILQDRNIAKAQLDTQSMCEKYTQELTQFTADVTQDKIDFVSSNQNLVLRAVNLSIFKVDCASKSTTVLTLTPKLAALDAAILALSATVIAAQRDLTCGKLATGIPQVVSALTAAKLRFLGSKYDGMWPTFNPDDFL